MTELASSANPRTGTFEAELKLDGADSRLLPGMIGNAELTRAAPQLTWVPIEALVEQQGLSASVYAFDPSGDKPKVAKRPVQIAYLDGARVGVSRGLQGVTQVVTDGAASCDTGTAVQLAQ